MWERLERSVIDGSAMRVVGGALLLTFAAAVVATCVGCSGPPRVAYVAEEEVSEAVVYVDTLVAEEVRRAGDLARAQVRREVAAGAIEGPTREATVEAALERFEDIMAPTTLARDVLRVSRSGVLTVSSTIDAWAQGTQDEADFIAAAACTVVALTRLVDAVTASGLTVPQTLLDAVRFVAPFADGACGGES